MDPAYVTAARAAISQAVLSAAGRPSFARTASEVFPRIYISDLATARTAATLHDLRITHVISALDHTVALPPEPAVRTLHVPIADLATTDLLPHLPVAVEFITSALQDAEARVLGVSRSASLVVAYLIASQHMRTDDAVALLKSKRRIVQPNSGFLEQLRRYEALVGAGKTRTK